MAVRVPNPEIDFIARDFSWPLDAKFCFQMARHSKMSMFTYRDMQAQSMDKLFCDALKVPCSDISTKHSAAISSDRKSMLCRHCKHTISREKANLILGIVAGASLAE